MNRLNVLIHQHHPFHQMALHQACNAQGVFRVRLADVQLSAPATLQATASADLLILDPAMPQRPGQRLLRWLRRSPRVPALLFVGAPAMQTVDFAGLARQRGLWVIDELRWPLSPPAFAQALARLHSVARALPAANGALAQGNEAGELSALRAGQ